MQGHAALLAEARRCLGCIRDYSAFTSSTADEESVRQRPPLPVNAQAAAFIVQGLRQGWAESETNDTVVPGFFQCPVFLRGGTGSDGVLVSACGHFILVPDERSLQACAQHIRGLTYVRTCPLRCHGTPHNHNIEFEWHYFPPETPAVDVGGGDYSSSADGTANAEGGRHIVTEEHRDAPLPLPATTGTVAPLGGRPRAASPELIDSLLLDPSAGVEEQQVPGGLAGKKRVRQARVEGCRLSRLVRSGSAVDAPEAIAGLPGSKVGRKALRVALAQLTEDNKGPMRLSALLSKSYATRIVASSTNDAKQLMEVVYAESTTLFQRGACEREEIELYPRDALTVGIAVTLLQNEENLLVPMVLAQVC